MLERESLFEEMLDGIWSSVYVSFEAGLAEEGVTWISFNFLFLWFDVLFVYKFEFLFFVITTAFILFHVDVLKWNFKP